MLKVECLIVLFGRMNHPRRSPVTPGSRVRWPMTPGAEREGYRMCGVRVRADAATVAELKVRPGRDSTMKFSLR